MRIGSWNKVIKPSVEGAYMDLIYEIAIANNLISKEAVLEIIMQQEKSSQHSIVNLIQYGISEQELYKNLARAMNCELIDLVHYITKPVSIKQEHLSYFDVLLVQESDTDLVLASWRAECKEKIIGAFENLYKRKIVFLLVTLSDYKKNQVDK